MTQFGAGAELAAQCPQPPSPSGWQIWSDANGPVPDALAQRAQALATDTTIPLGATETYPLPGVTSLIRVEPRMWGRDTQNNLIQGCFRVGAVYLPTLTETVTPPSTVDTWTKVAGVLTVASLAVGIAATVHAWNRH